MEPQEGGDMGELGCLVGFVSWTCYMLNVEVQLVDVEASSVGILNVYLLQYWTSSCIFLVILL